jgi:hypothetical protein
MEAKLKYYTTAAYKVETLKDNEFMYKGAIYYAENSKPIYLGNFRFKAKDHNDFLQSLELIIFQYFKIDDELFWQNLSAEEVKININAYCIEHKLSA